MHRLILIVFLGHGYIGRLEALLAAVANYRHPYVCMNGEEMQWVNIEARIPDFRSKLAQTDVEQS